ncbi:MAG: outer membrane beta-barrel protein [Fimbriimonadaceae bacterium]|nr:outer membrane beta-barrel protein [Chitinophagales bacterium]
MNNKIFGQEHEIGIWGGITHSTGDINSSLKSFQFFGGGGGFFYKYNFNPRLGWYIGGSAGKTEGYDYISDNVFQQTRNLDYKTNIIEASTRIDFNFFSFDRTKPKEWFTPYVFIGVNAFYFNPQGLNDAVWVDLQPLGTEGQNVLPDKEPYKRLQLGIPLGGGVKFALNENWALGVEGNWHKLFTDYLDDVSTRYADPAILSQGPNGDLAVAMADKSTISQDIPQLGESGRQRGETKYNDAYFYGGVVISYTIVNLKCPPPSAKGFKRK